MSQFDALRRLGLSEKEAQQTLQDDTRIDRGENLFPLSPEQEKVSKSMRQVSRAPGYKFQQRERKPNEAKRLLIETIAVTLRGVPGSVSRDFERPPEMRGAPLLCILTNTNSNHAPKLRPLAAGRSERHFSFYTTLPIFCRKFW